MRIWRKFLPCCVLVLLAVWLAEPVQAATVSGRASTVLEWYDTPENDTALPIHQYLRFSLLNIADAGYNFKFYGRLSEDLQSETDVESRLYFAYVEKKALWDGLDFRLGRQFISTTAGASLMDGLSVDYQFGGDYHVSVFGGGDVSYYSGYNADDIVWGTEVGGLFDAGDLDLNLSYVQKREDGRLDIELIGFDASYDLMDKLWLYNETQYDTLSERVSYQLIGGKYRFDGPYTFRLEYLYSLPVFSASSIYSVFAVEEYEEVLAEATWMVASGVRAFGRYTREIYDEFDDANVYEAGIEKLRKKKFSGYLSGVVRDDSDGQSLYGFKAYAAYKCHSKFRAGVGLNVDVLERDIAFFHVDDSDQDETTSTRIWVDGTYEITDSIQLQAKYEYIESDLWDYYNRGRVRLNFLF